MYEDGDIDVVGTGTGMNLPYPGVTAWWGEGTSGRASALFRVVEYRRAFESRHDEGFQLNLLLLEKSNDALGRQILENDVGISDLQ